MRAEIARDLGPLGSYDNAMAALGLGDRAGAVAGLARSMERHELSASRRARVAIRCSTRCMSCEAIRT
jgi:hypothetical protein